MKNRRRKKQEAPRPQQIAKVFRQEDPEQRALLAEYTGKVAAYRGRLRTLGMPPETMREPDLRTELRLTDLFIPLSLKGKEGKVSLQSMLSQGESAVLLGDPGTGKSTLLSYLALVFAGQAKLGDYVPPKDILPLFVPLGDYVRKQSQVPGLTLCGYLSQCAGTDFQMNLPERLFQVALRQGRAVLLLDGLDEVGRDVGRSRLSHTIGQVQKDFPRARIYVTSRVYGYTQDVALSSDDFVHYNLGPLEQEQIEGFIQNWYQIHLRDHARDRDHQIESLKNAILRTPSVRRMAENPLLLTLMAFIHKGLRRLPQARGELYEKCVEMLLKTWQEAKSEDGRPLTRHRAADLRLDWTRHKEYLSHLARRVQENTQSTEDEGGRGLMTRADAIRWLAEQHLRSARRHRPELDTLQAQSEMADLLDYLADYTGLLVDLGGDQFKFIHLSFLEHLAAWNFRCERHPNHKEFFLPRLGHQAWEEVLLLRLYLIRQGASGEEVFDELMGDIFGELRKTDDHPGWLTLVRAVRDNLDLRRDDAKEVLVRALLHFAKKPDFEGPWAEALKDVCLFSEENKPLLEEALLEQIQSTSASPAPGLGRAR